LKPYLFLDETGQDTRGLSYWVALVAVSSDTLEAIRDELTQIELTARKGQRWARTSRSRRQAYLDGLIPLLGRVRGFVKAFGAGTDYVAWSAQATALAAGKLLPNDGLRVVVDGGNWSEQEQIKVALRSQGLNWKKVTGARDEREPLLRLADALAGYWRDRSGGEMSHQAIDAWIEVL
jgi:hypothetical protein